MKVLLTAINFSEKNIFNISFGEEFFPINNYSTRWTLILKSKEEFVFLNIEYSRH